MKKSAKAVGHAGPGVYDRLFAGGCTAVFLVIMASLVEAVSLYLR